MILLRFRVFIAPTHQPTSPLNSLPLLLLLLLMLCYCFSPPFSRFTSHLFIDAAILRWCCWCSLMPIFLRHFHAFSFMPLIILFYTPCWLLSLLMLCWWLYFRYFFAFITFIFCYSGAYLPCWLRHYADAAFFFDYFLLISRFHFHAFFLIYADEMPNAADFIDARWHFILLYYADFRWHFFDYLIISRCHYFRHFSPCRWLRHYFSLLIIFTLLFHFIFIWCHAAFFIAWWCYFLYAYWCFSPYATLSYAREVATPALSFDADTLLRACAVSLIRALSFRSRLMRYALPRRFSLPRWWQRRGAPPRCYAIRCLPPICCCHAATRCRAAWCAIDFLLLPLFTPRALDAPKCYAWCRAATLLWGWWRAYAAAAATPCQRCRHAASLRRHDDWRRAMPRARLPPRHYDFTCFSLVILYFRWFSSSCQHFRYISRYDMSLPLFAFDAAIIWCADILLIWSYYFAPSSHFTNINSRCLAHTIHQHDHYWYAIPLDVILRHCYLLRRDMRFDIIVIIFMLYLFLISHYFLSMLLKRRCFSADAVDFFILIISFADFSSRFRRRHFFFAHAFRHLFSFIIQKVYRIMNTEYILYFISLLIDYFSFSSFSLRFRFAIATLATFRRWLLAASSISSSSDWCRFRYAADYFRCAQPIFYWLLRCFRLLWGFSLASLISMMLLTLISSPPDYWCCYDYFFADWCRFRWYAIWCFAAFCLWLFRRFLLISCHWCQRFSLSLMLSRFCSVFFRRRFDAMPPCWFFMISPASHNTLILISLSPLSFLDLLPFLLLPLPALFASRLRRHTPPVAHMIRADFRFSTFHPPTTSTHLSPIIIDCHGYYFTPVYSAMPLRFRWLFCHFMMPVAPSWLLIFRDFLIDFCCWCHGARVPISRHADIDDISVIVALSCLLRWRAAYEYCRWCPFRRRWHFISRHLFFSRASSTLFIEEFWWHYYMPIFSADNIPERLMSIFYLFSLIIFRDARCQQIFFFTSTCLMPLDTYFSWLLMLTLIDISPLTFTFQRHYTLTLMLWYFIDAAIAAVIFAFDAAAAIFTLWYAARRCRFFYISFLPLFSADCFRYFRYDAAIRHFFCFFMLLIFSLAPCFHVAIDAFVAFRCLRRFWWLFTLSIISAAFIFISMPLSRRCAFIRYDAFACAHFGIRFFFSLLFSFRHGQHTPPVFLMPSLMMLDAKAIFRCFSPDWFSAALIIFAYFAADAMRLLLLRFICACCFQYHVSAAISSLLLLLFFFFFHADIYFFR